MKKIAIIIAIAGVAWLGCSRLSSDYGTGVLPKCTVCHDLPPVGTVHSVHSAKLGYDCSICHEGYTKGSALTDGNDHDNGVVDVTISAPFDSLMVASFNPQTKTCTNMYCHGYFPQGDSAAVKESDSLGMRCNACHNLALMQSRGHFGHTTPATIATVLFQNDNCGYCHLGYNVLTGRVNDSTHCDGKVQTFNCARCPHK
jgi:predicted CxxxxCH...CXXCH cytochrome family protein